MRARPVTHLTTPAGCRASPSAAPRPEGWQQTIRRMVMLNDVTIEPETAREVVRYLSNHLGLAPEEARPAAYEAERRVDDHYYDDADIQETCTACHSMGRVISQRRTADEWSLLTAMHRGYYPYVDFQAFRSGPGDEPQPVDKAVEHLSERFPLDTPAWSAWSATMRPPRIAGTWALQWSRARAGPGLRPGDHRGDTGHRRRVHHSDQLRLCARRAARHTRGPGHRLYRLPVARPIVRGRRRRGRSA